MGGLCCMLWDTVALVLGPLALAAGWSWPILLKAQLQEQS